MEVDVKTLLKGGWIIDPSQNILQQGDVLIEDSRIVAIFVSENQTTMEADDIIDVTGLYIAPGFIDLHVHLREPGLSHKETIYQGSRACAKGGYTTVACMANTNPVIDHVAALKRLETIVERDSVIDILPIAAITLGLKGQALTDHDALIKNGAIAISDDGRTTMNADYMRAAYESSKRLGIPVITHSEDHEITSKYTDDVYPIEAEHTIVTRDINLLEEIGGHLHVAHVSGQIAIEAIKDAKAKGLNVTAEAAPHHFALNNEIVNTLEPMSKVNPPIRDIHEQNAVIEGLRNGTIDIIATDHAPHEESSKNGAYKDASYGISGIETAFSVSYTQLVKKSGFTLMELINKMSTKPAEILNVSDIGNLKVGSFADIVCFDITKENTINRHDFISKGHNTPFHQMTMTGEVVMTFKNGKRVYQKLEA